MFRMGFVRSLALIGVCILVVMFVVQRLSFGVQDAPAASAASPLASSPQAETSPHLGLAVMGILLAGLLIMLIRPRRRIVTTTAAQR